jgi:hypothetical protein
VRTPRALATAAVVAAALLAPVAAAPVAGAQTVATVPPRTGLPAVVASDIPSVLPVWDGGDHWQFCHDYADYSGDMDYAVGDPPRKEWAAWVALLDQCWGRKHVVHIRYNHEINGRWFPWSYKTPAQFKRDFADFKTYVKTHSKHARAINFGLALNFGTHRYTTEDYWTPAADYIAISIYQTPWDSNWAKFNASVIGPAWWLKWAKAHKRGLAYGEWGSLDVVWQGTMRTWGAKNGVLYGAYLYDPENFDWVPYSDTPGRW